MTTAADELAAAVTALREDPAARETVLPSGAIISRALAEPLAAWLEIAKQYADRWPPDHQANSPFRQGALAVARAINGGEQP